MSNPNTPGEMQTQIVERLLSSNVKPPAKNRALDKLKKTLDERLGIFFKDRLHHTVQSHIENAQELTLGKALLENSSNQPVAVVTDAAESIHALLSFNPHSIPFLTNVFFGGDLDVPISEKTAELSDSEFGMLEVFSTLVIGNLRKSISLDAGELQLFAANEIEDEHLEKGGALLAISLTIGPSSCRFNLFLNGLYLATFGDGQVGTDIEQVAGNQDFLETCVMASIRVAAEPQTLQQVHKLKVGDCIPLSEANTIHARLTIRGRNICSGRLGRSGDAYSFQVTDLISNQLGFIN